MIEPYSSELIWLIAVGFVIAFILAFGIGANDVANSFGTSVGSKVLTIIQACFLATFFEIAGALLIGYKVSDTMRKGILDLVVYESAEVELMLGMISALTSSAIWLLAATFLKLPISGTHSIVGSTIGFSLVARGTQGLHWKTLGTIVASWFISPILSGLTSVAIYHLIRYGILRRASPLEAGLCALPAFYGLTVAVNVFSVVHDGPKLLHMDGTPLWMAAAVSVGFCVGVAVLVWVVVVPWQRRRITEALGRGECGGREAVAFNIGSTENTPEGSPKKGHKQFLDRQLTVITENTEMLPLDMRNGAKYVFAVQTNEKNNGYTVGNQLELPNVDEMKNVYSTTTLSGEVNPSLSPNSSGVPLIMNKSQARLQNDDQICALELQQNPDLLNENPAVSKLFSFLQVLTAMFSSFAHGGNDVSNAIGPLIALWLIYTEGSVAQKSETPFYILLYGGLGISVGLWLWGRRVIQTIGEDLTTISPSTGFTIEIGATLTVLLASKIGLPISTTHCKVGSVVFVGWFSSSEKGVDWKLFRNIIYAWVVTVPVTALISAGCMYMLTSIIL